MTESEWACIDIFNDYSWEEMEPFSPALVKAWKIGEYLVEKQQYERVCK